MIFPGYINVISVLTRSFRIWKSVEMANQVNFNELLEKKYASFTVEINAFLDSCDVSSSNDIAADIIYQAIRNVPKIDDDLKALYREAVYGTNKEVKKRIRNRITNFRRTMR